jgi:hypothetical protein
MKVKKTIQLPPIPIWWPDVSGDWKSWLPSKGNVLFTVLMMGTLLWAQSAGAISFGAPISAATSTSGIPYQGRLADKDGAPLTQTVTMIFRLYGGAAGGSPLWTEQWTGSTSVQVSDGLFSVMLGSITPIPPNVISANGTLYLGITVGTDNEMAPRVQLGSVPFAVHALTVPDGSVTTAKVADGAITSAKLSRNVVSLRLTSPILMPTANTTYDVLSTSLNLSGETLVTIFAQIGAQNNAGASVFFPSIEIDGIAVIRAEKWNDHLGYGNTISVSTSVLLQPGQHQVKLRVSSQQPNGIIIDDERTQMTVIQG